MNLQDIVRELDKNVYGQAEAKHALASAAHLSLLEEKIRLTHPHTANGYQSNIYKNVFLTGASGSGKTLLVNELARIIDKELVVVDASTLTAEGYKGYNPTEMVQDILRQTGDTDLEDCGAIVFLDEMDKLTNAKGDDGWKSSVQGQLLKKIEESPNVLWILAGNYPEIRAEVKNIGFGKKLKEEVFIGDSMVQSLEKIGVSSQLLGRVRFFAALKKHDKEDLIGILKNPNMLTKNFRDFCKMNDVRFVLTEKQIETIATKCENSDTGARMLQHELNTLLMKRVADLDTEVVKEDSKQREEESKALDANIQRNLLNMSIASVLDEDKLAMHKKIDRLESTITWDRAYIKEMEEELSGIKKLSLWGSIKLWWKNRKQ